MGQIKGKVSGVESLIRAGRAGTSISMEKVVKEVEKSVEIHVPVKLYGGRRRL